MSKAIHFLVAAVPLVIGLGTASASSVSIAAAGNSEAGSVGMDQGLGTDGYIFFPAFGQTDYPGAYTYVQPAYVNTISTGSDLIYGGGTSAKGPAITAYTAATSNTFDVGEEYQTTTSSITLVTITLTGSVPQEFQLGVLGDTWGNNRYTNYTVSDADGTATATQADADLDPSSPGAPGATEFYYFDISNAYSGDTISIAGLATGTSGDTDPMLSGITFDTISTAPEPASLGILAFGAVGLMTRRRRHI